MPQDLWELLFRANRLMHLLAKGHISAAAELAEVAMELEGLASGVPAVLSDPELTGRERS